MLRVGTLGSLTEILELVQLFLCTALEEIKED